jgi:hypothetical protein
MEENHNIRGVFLETFNDRSELANLINSNLAKIDLLYLNNPIADEFYHRLLHEISRTEGFTIEFF